jgi:hypothetical protein
LTRGGWCFRKGQRPIESREMGEVVSIPRVGGLHHRYSRVLQRAA